MSNLKLEAGGYYYLLPVEAPEPETRLTAAAAAAARTAAGRAAAAPRRQGGAQGRAQERPRACTCKECGVERDRDEFSARQWRTPQPSCRACRPAPAGRCAAGTSSGQASASEAEADAVATHPCSSTRNLVS